MHAELKRCNFIGDLASMYDLAQIAIADQDTDLRSITSICALRSEINVKIKPCVAFYGELNLVVDDSGKIKATDNGKQLISLPFAEFVRKLSEYCLTYLVQNQYVQPEAIIYDYRQNICRIKKSGFPLSVAVFRNFLIESGALVENDPGIFDVQPLYEPIFEEAVRKKKPTMTLEQLMELHKRQAQQGRLAEEFVVEFEKQRLLWSPNSSRVKQISDFDVSAGYDVISFCDSSSTTYDRFIEVKSFVGSTSFYWSANEMKTAKELKDKYYLYLVNMEEYRLPGYEPLIVQNPTHEIFESDEWLQDIASRLFNPYGATVLLKKSRLVPLEYKQQRK